ncbi:hypothetical protein Tco_0156763 [Tanacetum coccineum]
MVSSLFPGCISAASAAVTLRIIMPLQLGNSLSLALEACVVDSFAIEKLLELDLYEGFIMSPPDLNNTYTKPSSENQILGFIKTLGYDKDPDTKMIVVSKMVATRLHQLWRAIMCVLNKSLTRKDSSWDTIRLPILQILWGIVHYQFGLRVINLG